MTATGYYFMAHNLKKNVSVICSKLTGKISAELAMQIIAISIALRPNKGFSPTKKNGTKKMRKKSALEDTILELTINKSKMVASISAIVNKGSS